MRQGAARPVDPGRDFPVFFRWAAWGILACFSLGVFNGLFAVEVKPAAGADEVVKLGGVEWLGIEDGIESVRQRYQPALGWYTGSTSSDGLGLLKRLEKSSFRRLFSRYVLIRVTPDDLGKRYSPRPNGPRPRKAVKKKAPARPPALKPAEKQSTVGEELRLPVREPALVVLDFRERLVERYDNELPGRDTLSSRLKKILKISEYYARQSLPIEKLLLDSKEAQKLGNQRTAVLKVRALEDPGLRKKMDPVLQSWVATMIRDYRQAARKALDKAIALEREGDKLKSDSALKYTKAIDAFEKIAKDYPFKDIVVEANRHSGEILRKMTGFGKKPF
ncbi:MAG: hypothetical protein VX958_06590 [Planctomycetota bacterium]|nr:hypothetical protein [Planctomycetota bacterium]